MAYKIISFREATKEDIELHTKRCVAFWDKLKTLCLEEGIIPYPHPDQEQYSFQLEAWTDRSWEQVRNKMWMTCFLFGIVIPE
jgi:hypothetical protein